MFSNLEKLETELQDQPIAYTISLHLSNLVLFSSSAEVEAAIVMYCAGKRTKNTFLARHLTNIEHTYGPAALMDTASLMGFCTLDKVS